MSAAFALDLTDQAALSGVLAQIEPRFGRLDILINNAAVAHVEAFDERSVDRVEAHGYRYLKIASCSLGDWPLMERIARSPLPILASTAGAPLEVLDPVETGALVLTPRAGA